MFNVDEIMWMEIVIESKLKQYKDYYRAGDKSYSTKNCISALESAIKKLEKIEEELKREWTIEDVIKTVKKDVVTKIEFKKLRSWYFENCKDNFLGWSGLDGKGEKYELKINYNSKNEIRYEFYLEND